MTTLEFNNALNNVTPSLMPFAMKLTKDQDEANDLLQDTLLKAFRNKEKFATGTNLKAWLYTIMKNTFITNYQRMMRRGTFIDTSDNYYQLNTRKDYPERMADAKLRLKEVHHEIDKLDENYSKPFMMHFKGFKYHEIAERLEIPIGTVKNRIHIARKKLQTRLRAFRNN